MIDVRTENNCADMTVVYSKNKEFWRDFGQESKLETIEDFKKIVNDVSDVCFISGCGVGFATKNYKKGRAVRFQFNNLTPKLLEGLAEGFFFNKEANAKMWYCCLKYALENEECREFWDKYKDSSAGGKFMAIMLGSKGLDEN